MLTRRSLLRGLVAAPAVVSAGSIMPVRLWRPEAPLFTSEEITLTYDGLWRAVLAPAMAELAELNRRIEFDFFNRVDGRLSIDL